MRIRGVIAAALAGSLVAGVFVASPVLGTPGGKSGAVTELIARLNGEKEVPGPGDPNGKGRALIFPNVKKRRVCFDLKWKRIQGPLQAHIHKGGPDVAGPIKVTLFDQDEPLPGPSAAVDGCIKKLKRKLVRKIKNYPKRYYVNVHNENYPAGAIRGQLKVK
jgi:CHRD domain